MVAEGLFYAGHTTGREILEKGRRLSKKVETKKRTLKEKREHVRKEEPKIYLKEN
jgi:hypothetical protein